MSPRFTRLARNAALVAALIVVVGGAWTFLQLHSAWSSTDRVAFDTRQARESLTRVSQPPDHDTEGTLAGDTEVELNTVELEPAVADGWDVFLIVGTDSREGLDSLEYFGDFPGERADVIMLFLRPHDGRPPALVSIPRDLYVADLCRGGRSRINAAYAGCGEEISGPALLALTVEEFTGLAVDHFAAVDLAGFQKVVDRLGGYEICVEHPVRDAASGLDLPAGCTLADGTQTLAWLRSRQTEELVDGSWRTVPGVSDLTRMQRQQQFLVDILGRMTSFRSPNQLTALAADVAGLLTVDDDLTLSSAVDLAWSLRSIDLDQILRPEIPVRDETTSTGAAVLVPAAEFSTVLSDAYDGSMVAERETAG